MECLNTTIRELCYVPRSACRGCSTNNCCVVLYCINCAFTCNVTPLLGAG